VTDIAVWCARSSLAVAHDLIGCELLIDGVGGRIVECEAYTRDDPASHAFPGPTPRNASMFGPAGRIYVYLNYGLHWMLNIVCGAHEGAGEAVLIRALEPTTGLEQMRERRGREALIDLCRGPGRLGQALAVGPALDGEAIGAGRIELRPAPAPGPVVQTPRIGITRAQDRPWRFLLEGSPYVSPFRRSRSVSRARPSRPA
jgi:DNA-3-methyladenine glycosylase